MPPNFPEGGMIRCCAFVAAFASLAGAAPSAEPQSTPESGARTVLYVRVAVDVDGLFFQGNPTTLDQLPADFNSVEDPADTIIELAYASENVTIGRLKAARNQCVQLSRQIGFKTVIEIGQEPASSGGSSDQLLRVPTTQPVKMAHVVKFSIGERQFKGGDTITDIHGTSDTFEMGGTYQVKGKYHLESHDHATLSFYESAPPGHPPVSVGDDEPAHSITLQKGNGEFTLVKYMPDEGYPHISFYGDDGNFGGVYFGSPGWVR